MVSPLPMESNNETTYQRHNHGDHFGGPCLLNRSVFACNDVLDVGGIK